MAFLRLLRYRPVTTQSNNWNVFQMRLQIDQAQKRLVARKIRSDFDQFWELAVESGDSDFLRYVYALIFKVYELSLEDKYLTKMQACRYIPLKHAATCKKYLDIASDKGFFIESDAESDARKKIIKPGPELLRFVENSIESNLAEMAEIMNPDSDGMAH